MFPVGASGNLLTLTLDDNKSTPKILPEPSRPKAINKLGSKKCETRFLLAKVNCVDFGFCEEINNLIKIFHDGCRHEQIASHGIINHDNLPNHRY